MANRSSEIPEISIIVTEIDSDLSVTYSLARDRHGRTFTFSPLMPSCRRVCAAMVVGNIYLVRQLRVIQGTMWESATQIPGRVRIRPTNDAITRSVAAQKSLRKAPKVNLEELFGISFTDPVGDAKRKRAKELEQWHKHQAHLLDYYQARNPDMPEEQLLAILQEAKAKWESNTHK